jgi:hypothetical protein
MQRLTGGRRSQSRLAAHTGSRDCLHVAVEGVRLGCHVDELMVISRLVELLTSRQVPGIVILLFWQLPMGVVSLFCRALTDEETVSKIHNLRLVRGQVLFGQLQRKLGSHGVIFFGCLFKLPGSHFVSYTLFGISNDLSLHKCQTISLCVHIHDEAEHSF